MSYKLSDDERAEFRPHKPKYIRCADCMCGAEDCPNCHPEILTPQPVKKMTSIREQMEADVDDVAMAVRAIKDAVEGITNLHNQLSTPISAAEGSLRVMLSKSFISRDEKLRPQVEKFLDLVQRVHELKNTMDMGTLVVQTDRVMDAVWKSLP